MNDRLNAVANRLIDAAVAAGFFEQWARVERSAAGSWITAHVRRVSVRASHGDGSTPPPFRTPTVGDAPPIDADLHDALAGHLDAVATYLPPTRPMFFWSGAAVSLSDLRAAMRERTPVAEAWVAMVWRLAADGFGLRTG